jgi:hypothetical protein
VLVPVAVVKMVDAKSLDEALEKITTFLASKADGPTSGATVPQEEVVQKLVLVPKLTSNLRVLPNI